MSNINFDFAIPSNALVPDYNLQTTNGPINSTIFPTSITQGSIPTVGSVFISPSNGVAYISMGISTQTPSVAGCIVNVNINSAKIISTLLTSGAAFTQTVLLRSGDVLNISIQNNNTTYASNVIVWNGLTSLNFTPFVNV